jgi:photosystem II stability/assembly factor-like uncharacterized protein
VADEDTYKPTVGHRLAQNAAPDTTDRRGRRGPQRELSDAERELAAKAVREVIGEIKARARGLRRLGYGLLLLIAGLLFGGMGVAFYSQILLITHSTAQQEAVRTAEATRNADQKKLDELSPKFDVLRREIADAAMVAVPPTQLGIVRTGLNSVQFAGDGQRGWAMGHGGTILATKNSGETWLTQISGTTQTLVSVQFAADGQRGWAVGVGGTILATKNGGETWQAQTSGTPQLLFSVQFAADGQHGWAVGTGGTILATKNGGETWQAQTSGTTQPLYSVQFAADGQHGWAVGTGGTILATKNGGGTWQAQTSGTTQTLLSVQFAADGQQGWAVGDGGTILATKNGGETWQAQTSGTTQTLTSVQFAADGRRGWAAGDGILQLNRVDLAAIDVALDLSGITKALAAAGIKEQAIGQPLETLKALEGNRDTLKAQLDQDDTEIQKRKDALPNVFSTKLDPLEVFVFITKFALLIVLFFLVNILVSVYRYSQRLAAQYDAQANALVLSSALLDPTFHRLVRTLTPAGIDFGKMEAAPTDKILNLVHTALRQRGS